MSDTKLADAYRRYIGGDSTAWDAFPNEQKVCEITEPLCNNHIKIRNYYMARPYNFMMNIDQWSEVTNKVELLAAIRFGMEWDTNKFPAGNMGDPAFHTQMYIKFHKYLMRTVMFEASKLVAEFQTAVFKARFMTTFAVADLVEARNSGSPTKLTKEAFKKAKQLKGQIDSINVAEASIAMNRINDNKGPFTINKQMFIKVFNQDYNPGMVSIMKSQGIYLGDPENVQYSEFDKKNW